MTCSMLSVFRLGVLSLGLVAGLAEAQPVASDTAPTPPREAHSPQKVIYLLIDASGSMRGKDAEGVASRLLDDIIREDKDALVSRTYFRAKDRAACWSPVEISQPVAAADSVALPEQFFDDFTPMGEALRAAILAAGDKPADIYLISDEEPTSSCGVDICAVASSMLPRPGINVRSIPVAGTHPANHDRLGCIEGAQGAPEVTSPLERGDCAGRSRAYGFSER